MDALHDINEAVRRSGATLRQIDHLISAGLVTPAEEAPRRGMPRMITHSSTRYISVAARLMSWGVPVENIKSEIGTDQPDSKRSPLMPHSSYIDRTFEKLHDPKQRKRFEILLMFRIVEPGTNRTLFFQHFFTSAASVVSAATKTGVDGFFINMTDLAKQVDAEA